MTDMIEFIRDNIDNNPQLLSFIANLDSKTECDQEHRELIDAFRKYTEKYGTVKPTDQAKKSNELHTLSQAVQVFKYFLDESNNSAFPFEEEEESTDIEDLILKKTPTDTPCSFLLAQLIYLNRFLAASVIPKIPQISVYQQRNQ